MKYFLSASAALLALALAFPAQAADTPVNKRDDSASEKLGMKLSLQCWTFNKLTFFEDSRNQHAVVGGFVRGLFNHADCIRTFGDGRSSHYAHCLTGLESTLGYVTRQDNSDDSQANRAICRVGGAHCVAVHR